MVSDKCSKIKTVIDNVSSYIKKHRRTINFYAKTALFIGSILLLTWITRIFFLLSSSFVWENPLFCTIKIIINIVVSIFLVIYPFAHISVRIYKRDPVWRDRFLFAHSGWGMAMYSGITIIIVISFICAIANTWVVNTQDIYNGTDDNIEHTLVWNVISQFADPGNLPQSKDWGTFVALLSAFAGILCLSGLVVSSLVSMISRRTQQWKAGLIHYNYDFNNYVVVIGVNEQTASIVRKALDNPCVRYVLIQTRKNVETERARLELYLEHKDEERVVFYYGDRALYEDIQALRFERAIKEIYILGEDVSFEDEGDHDSYNITCLEYIAQYVKDCPDLSQSDTRLKCHVNFEYQSTFMAFKFTHIYRSLNEKIEFIPFNVHEIWAKKIFVNLFANIPFSKHAEKNVQRYLPLDAYWEYDRLKDKKELKFIHEDSLQTVHLMIVGMNQMGVALAMQAALLVHLPNYQKDKSRTLRTTISFIDENAVREGEFLRSRYDALFSLCRYRTIVSNNHSFNSEVRDYTTEWIDPMIKGRYAHMGENFMDIQWEFIEGNVASSEIRDYMSAVAKDVIHKTCTIAVCFNNPQQSIATALYLPEIVLKRAMQILVYQQNSYEIINKVANTEKIWKRYEKLKPFGMIESGYPGDTFDNIMAKYINMIYKDKLQAVPESDDSLHNYERANQLWKQLGIVDKYSNIDLVDSFDMKLRSLGKTEEEQLFAIEQKGKIYNLTKAEHQRWLTERLTMGYRPLDKDELAKFSTKDDDGKLHLKELLKEKSRAHLDICSFEDLEKGRDEIARKNNMDERIVKMILPLKQLIQGNKR